MTTNQDNAEILREEILSDARREGEETVVRARQEAEVFLANADAEADQLRQERRDQAHREAAHQNELILATVPVEVGRLRAARIEALLESVYKDACQQLLACKGFEYRESVIALTSHAINRMAGTAFVVKVAEADRDILGSNLYGDIACNIEKSASITISYESEFIGRGGVIIEDAEARQVWDNRLLKRLERMWPELRRQIALQVNFVPKTGSGGDNL